MKFFNTYYLYLVSLVLFILFYTTFKPKPTLNEITLKDQKTDFFDEDLRRNLNLMNNSDTRFNIGKKFFINEGENWYGIFQFSFWDKSFVKLAFVDQQLKTINLQVKKKGDSNYALATYNDENVAYACIENARNFYYDINHEYIPEAKDISHWKKVFLSNLKSIIFLFKPNNYKCLFVLTSNTKLFESSDQEINNLILEKFNY